MKQIHYRAIVCLVLLFCCSRFAHSTQIPVLFERNSGIQNSKSKFFATGLGYKAQLSQEGLQVRVHGEEGKESQLSFHLVGGNPNPLITEVGPVQSTANYFIGNDPSNWKTDVPRYAAVAYKSIYPGIDWLFYEQDGLLEYDFIVAPEAIASLIDLKVTGADRVVLDQSGNLAITTAAGTLKMLPPVAYQCETQTAYQCETQTAYQCEGSRRKVPAQYRLHDGSIQFAIGSYDHGKPLVIDPKISYGTLLGGKTFDITNDVAVDKKGNFYVAGYTEANTPFPGFGDAFVHKFSPTGVLLFSTFIVGNSGEFANSIAVSPTGVIFLGGDTSSADFPIVGGFQKKLGGGLDGFIVKLSNTGKTILKSSFLGGSGADDVTGIALGAGTKLGNGLYIFGDTNSKNFPRKDPTQSKFGGGRQDGFLTILDATNLGLLMSTYVGLDGSDEVPSITLNPVRGDLYLAVFNFDGKDGSFIAHFKPASANASQNFIGPIQFYEHSDHFVQGLIDGFIVGEVFMKYVFGAPWSISAFRGLSEIGAPDAGTTVVFAIGQCAPVPPATFCSDNGALLVLDQDLNPQQMLNFGGTGPGSYFVNDITVSKNGTIVMVGDTVIKNLPVKNAFQAKNKGRNEGFVLSLAPGTVETKMYSYLGGTGDDFPRAVAVDRFGNIIVVGQTSSRKFPTTANAVKKTLTGTADGFVTKITP